MGEPSDYARSLGGVENEHVVKHRPTLVSEDCVPLGVKVAVETACGVRDDYSILGLPSVARSDYFV